MNSGNGFCGHHAEPVAVASRSLRFGHRHAGPDARHAETRQGIRCSSIAQAAGTANQRAEQLQPNISIITKYAPRRQARRLPLDS